MSSEWSQWSSVRPGVGVVSLRKSRLSLDVRLKYIRRRFLILQFSNFKIDYYENSNLLGAVNSFAYTRCVDIGGCIRINTLGDNIISHYRSVSENFDRHLHTQTLNHRCRDVRYNSRMTENWLYSSVPFMYARLCMPRLSRSEVCFG